MSDVKDISAQVLSETIGYLRLALEPDRWPEVMRRVTELTSQCCHGHGAD